MEKKKYVVFGGSFDPFTLAHKEIVDKLFKDFGAYKVIIAPSFVKWYRKDKEPWMDWQQKQETVNNILHDSYYEIDCLFWDGDFRLSLCCKSDAAKAEFEKRGFIDTLLDIKAYFYAGLEDDQEWYFCIGSDQLAFFKNWKMWEEVLKQAQMIVVNGRGGKFVESDIPHIELKIDEKFLNYYSASKIREQYKAEGKTPDNYIKWTYNEYVRDKDIEELLTTPIFDVTEGPEADNGLKPIKINASDWVSIMVEKEGKLLVEKQFRYGANDFVEEFPCGMVEKDEDPLDAVVRELEEETGIKLLDKTDIVKLGQTNPNPAFMTNMMHYFYVNLDYAKWIQNEQKLDEHEELECYWRAKDRFMFELADDAHACGKKQVPAIALAMVKLYENAHNYPCGG